MRIPPEHFLALAYHARHSGRRVPIGILLTAREECEADLLALGHIRTPESIRRYRRAGNVFRIRGFDRRRYLYLTAPGREAVMQEMKQLRAQYPWLAALGPSRHAEAVAAASRMRKAFQKNDEDAIRAEWPDISPQHLSMRLDLGDKTDQRVCPVRSMAICEAWRRVMSLDPAVAVAYGAVLFAFRDDDLSVTRAIVRITQGLSNGRTASYLGSDIISKLQQQNLIALTKGRPFRLVLSAPAEERYRLLREQAASFCAKIKPGRLRELRAMCFAPRSIWMNSDPEKGYLLRLRMVDMDRQAAARGSLDL